TLLGMSRRDWVYVRNWWVTPRRGSTRLGVGGMGLGYSEAALKRLVFLRYGSLLGGRLGQQAICYRKAKVARAKGDSEAPR
ncbi:hypothetical protein PIB30_095072, partial [Stylosanthes scabra]|nr:hypothetical protein [Stylosanthes scabra]